MPTDADVDEWATALVGLTLDEARTRDPEGTEEAVAQRARGALVAALHRMDDTPRLSDFEVDLFRVPNNGLAEMVEGLDMDEDTKRAFNTAKSHYDKVRIVSRWCGPDPSAAPAAVRERVFSSRSTVQSYSLGQPMTREALLEALPLPAVSTSTPAVDKPQPTHTIEMPDGRVAVVYAWRAESRGVIDPDGYLVQPAEQKRLALLLDPVTGAIETRGSGVEADRVMRQFQLDIEAGGLASKLSKVKLEDVEYEALKTALSGSLIRESYTGADEATTGIGQQVASLSSKYRGTADLAATPGYADLPDDRNRHHWYIHFEVDGERYSVRINFKDGRLVFQEGRVSDRVIRYVLDAISRVRAR